jgi:AcrR family transcriptional regulator
VDTFPLPLGPPRAERADAVRNREHLLAVARELIASEGAERLTMDCLAERAGLGKGTVFRRFGTRAGIFAALLDDAERTLQQQVLSGPPPLGPGADPVARLVAYGRARIEFLRANHAVARAALERDQPLPVPERALSAMHIRMLISQARRDGLIEIDDVDSLALQLTAALEGPLLLYLAADSLDGSAPGMALAASWQILVEGVMRCRPATR